VLWLVTASIGDAPIAIIACVALVLGVVLAARGRRGEPVAERAGAPEQPTAAPEEPAAAVLSVPVAPAAAPITPAATPVTPPAPAVGHGPIRFVTHDDEPGEPAAVEPEPTPPPAPPEPVAAESEPGDHEPPPPPATPQPPSTTFRQGSIKIGGLDRRKT
jgi:hypothetical protein